jgi:hypothetical protein
MKIISALIKTDVRLVYEWRWLVYDRATEEWVVYDNNINLSKSGSKCVVGRTKTQDQAIAWLLEET